MSKNAIDAIKREIRKADKSQVEIAKEVGVSPQHLSAVLNGRYRASESLINRLLGLFGKKIDNRVVCLNK